MKCQYCNGTGNVPDASEAKNLLVRAGRSQREVAIAMGYSPMYLSDLLNGKRSWNATLYGKFKKALIKPRPCV